MRVAAILAGALLLMWPAFLNGYPLLFSDTGAFLHQVAPPPSGPLVVWDKPHVYGPLLLAFSWHVTLWGPAIAQGLMLSWLLWVTQRVLRGGVDARAHLLACVAVAALTTAPFTAALLMPDVFAPAVLLAMLLLAFGGGTGVAPSQPAFGLAAVPQAPATAGDGFAPATSPPPPQLRGRDGEGAGASAITPLESLLLFAIASIGIAAHLSHLPLAASIVALALILTRRLRPALRAAAPLLAAIAILLTTNLWGHDRATLSPHGATFMLARLQADGPAAAVIKARCPDSGWYLCAFADRLPMDSDEFLWAPGSPVNRAPDGSARFLGGALLSPEARTIVAETLKTHPVEVATAMARNTLRQLGLALAGDTLVADHLAVAVRPRIAEAFPARELAAYDAAHQPRGALTGLAIPLHWPHALVLVAGAVLALVAWWRAARTGDLRRLGLVLGVLVGVTANAVATGALSKPHLRYEARILWLMPIVAVLALAPRRR